MILIFILIAPPVGFADEAVRSFAGNHLTGTVTVLGKIPKPRRFNLSLFSDPYFCGRISDGKGWRIAPRPSLNSQNELSGAVVYIKEIKTVKPRINTPLIVQTKNCVFLPHIDVTHVGQTVQFENWDPVDHKIEVFHTSQYGGTRLLKQTLQPHPDNRKSDFLSGDQAGIQQPGAAILYQSEKPGILVVRCQLHDYMVGWNVVLPHPYFSMTGTHGEFSISDIPPGIYQLVVWHPLGQKELTISIKAGENAEMNINLVPTPLTTYPEKEPKKNPFAIDLVGESKIVPSVEVQQ